jgi:aerotaxis receptor
MRDNGPVTQREVIMGDDSIIVSKTDDKGRIQFVNKDFIDISGFKEEELIGQPHNLIRHSDMPPEAFKDMWNDLSSGKPWSGYVKNRVKNGDHYWVHANAMPVIEGGRVTGFISIRNKPPAKTTQIVGEIYKKFIDKKAGTLEIKHGMVIDNKRSERLRRWYEKFGSKVVVMGTLMCLLLIIVGGLGFHGILNLDSSIKTVYEDRTVPSGDLANINRLIYDNVFKLALIAGGTRTDLSAVVKEIKDNEDTIDKTWSGYMLTYLTPEEKILADKFASSYADFKKMGVEESIKLSESQSDSDLKDHMKTVRELFYVVNQDNKDLIKLQLDVAKHEFDAANKVTLIDTILVSIGIIIAIIVAAIASQKLRKLLLARINYIDSSLNSIAGGNFTTDIELSQDELQSTMITIKALQAKLLFAELEKKELARQSKIDQMKLADDFDQRTSNIIKSLAAAATEMQATAAQMTAASNNTAHASQIVASAATEADSNVQTVAAATEELSASSSEIARQISSVAEKSTRASGEAARTNQQVGELNSLADSIGEVVGAIKGIAEQTNLLALNATIEAARAGEAGKGFAVVADEVKKLATETASKTIQIDERVGKIQSAIRATVEAVGRIISDVNDIDHSTATVASAVEEQNAATAETGRNVSEASTGTQQVAQNIVDVQKSAEETGEAANNLNQAANELAEIAENLQEQVATFLGEIRAA